MSPGNMCRPVASISCAARARSGAISTMRPSETRISAFTRPSGRTSVPPRMMVSITTSELQFLQEFQSGIEGRSHVIFADVLGRIMADASLAAEEYHTHRHLRSKDHRIVSGTARHSVGLSPRLLKRAIEH